MEWEFRPDFSLEFDAIYRRLFSGVGGIGGPTVTWEMPIMAKYRTRIGSLRPHIEGGLALRTTGNLNTEPSHTGVTAGAGIDWQWKGLRMGPTVRYTRWAADQDRVKQDQVELLFAVSHSAVSDRHPLGGRVGLGAVGGYNLLVPSEDQLLVGTGPSAFRVQTAFRRSFIVGPRISFRFNERWSGSVEANYRQIRIRTRTSFRGTLPDGTTQQREFTNSAKAAVLWQFPALVRRNFGTGNWRPFLEAGPTFRLPQEYDYWLPNFGASAGVGVEFRWKGLRFDPSLRYSRWGSAEDRLGRTAPDPIRRNQLDLMFGFRF